MGKHALGLPIAAQLQNAKVVLSVNLRETYSSGKSNTQVTLGTYQYLASTTPILGTSAVFTTCTGTTTVPRQFNGTLSLINGSTTFFGLC